MEDNFVQSFQLESSHIRGRIVRLGDGLDQILKAHTTYPDEALHLTGETLILCTLLSSMLKYEGIFTLQIRGSGLITMLVADVTSSGNIRACAAFREGESYAFGENRAELLGEGHMAFTVDQGENTDRYQGIVELKPDSLVSSIQHYFTQSEQIATGIMMSVGKVDGQWRGTGLMVQQMPEETQTYNKDQSHIDEDDWRRTMILLGSVKDSEMLDPALSAEDLLYRLFHEEGVRLYEPCALQAKCRCSPERVEAVLASMADEDIDEMVVDGKIIMTCEFCSRDYVLNPEDFKKGDRV